MDRPQTRTLPTLDSATPAQLEEALVHWDELVDSDLVALASHAKTSKQLAGLRAVESWMRETADRADQAQAASLETSVDPCPDADLLYDFSRGPGFAPLDSGSEQTIAKHLATCEACSQLVNSLACPPPLPLDLVEELEVAPTLSHEPARPLRPNATWRTFLVAASLAGIALVPFMMGGGQSTLADLPQAPIYRGTQQAEPLFPRGRLLALADDSGSANAAEPAFELTPVEGASEYRVQVFQNDGGAFDPGSHIESLRGPDPELQGGPLQPGHYTWRAWATVDGLDRDLGAQEFEVVAQDELVSSLKAIDGQSSLSDRIDLIGLLHEAGFLTDARALAKSLPKSPERDAYLSPSAR